MQQSIPAVPIPPPPGQPPGISIKKKKRQIPGGGDKQVCQMPRVGTKKRRQMPHPRDHIGSNTAQDLINHKKKVSLIIYKTIKAGFHIIAMIAAIAGSHTSAIDRSAQIISQRSSCFYMIATIVITEIVATIRKPAFIFNTFRLFTRASILDPVVHLF